MSSSYLIPTQTLRLYPKEWPRFYLYSSKVQTICGLDKDSIALIEIERDRSEKSPPPLFPNLRRLKWECTTPIDSFHWGMNALMSSSIEQIWLKSSWLYKDAFARFCLSLVEKAPQLHSLKIQAGIVEPVCEDILIALIPLLQNLRAIYIPPQLASEHVMNALLLLPRLHAVQINMALYCEYSDGFVDGDRLLETRVLSGGAWKYFAFADSTPSFNAFDFLRSGKLPFLTHLTIEPALLFAERDGADLLADTLVVSFPLLQSLVIGKPTMAETSTKHIHWKTIRTLLRLENLTTLEAYSWRVLMDLSNFTELAQNRSTWISVVIYPLRSFNFRDMLVFAKHCPRLETLGSSFDEKEIPSPSQLDPNLVFHSLQCLHFGNKRIPRESAQFLATFLYKICKRPPTLIGWHDELWAYVEALIATLCLVEKRTTGVLSEEARAYVTRIAQSKGSQLKDHLNGLGLSGELTAYTYRVLHRLYDQDDDDDDDSIYKFNY